MPFHTPFSALTPNIPVVATSTPAAPAKAAKLLLSGQAKLVVRRERKGRAGKTVTLVSGLVLPEKDLEMLAEKLRKSLGCGSHLEDKIIVVQGDHSERIEALLRSLGAKLISVSG